jgi:hypothetical protein
MKHLKYLLLAVFISFPFAVYSQYLEPGDIGIFIGGYGRIKSVLEEHKDGPPENEDWTNYNELTDAFARASEEYIKSSTRNNENNAKRAYREILDCKVPVELEQALRAAGWESGGNKKLLTISLGWGFLYAAQEMEKETADLPRVFYKLFVEKYYTSMVKILGILDSRDVELLRTRMEDIKPVMLDPGQNG